MKFFFTYPVFLLLSSIGYAQVAPHIEWQKCLGGSGDENLFTLKQTADKGFILGGISNSSDGQVTTPNKGGLDAWVVKTDSLGNIEWNVSLGGTAAEMPAAVMQTADGDYIVVGNTGSADGDFSDNRGMSDGFAARISKTGTVLWKRCLGGTWDDQINDVMQVSDTVLLLSGLAESIDGDVVGNTFTPVRPDWFVLLSLNSGNILGQKCMVAASMARIVKAKQGGYVMTGGDNGFGGSNNVFLAKLDDTLGLTWIKYFGGSGIDFAMSVAQTKDSGYLVSATTQSTDGDVVGHRSVVGEDDWWILKFDDTGKVIWKKCYGSISEPEMPWEGIETRDGQYIVCGEAAYHDGDVSTGFHGSYDDAWLLSLSPDDGTIVWQLCLGNTGMQLGRAVQETTDNGGLIAGCLTDATASGQVTGNHGGGDIWLVKLGFREHVNVPVQPGSKVSVYPTITTGMVNIDNYPATGKIHLFNILGQPVPFSLKEYNNKHVIDLNGLPPGNYILQVVEENINRTYRIQLK